MSLDPFPNNGYGPDSPDTFFVQPPSTSDSATTPPLATAYARARNAIIRPPQQPPDPPLKPQPAPMSHYDNQHNHRLHHQSSQSHVSGPSTPRAQSIRRSSTTPSSSRKEDPRDQELRLQLFNTSHDTLIDLFIKKNNEAKDAKLLVSSALVQVERMQDKLMREEQYRKAMEEELQDRVGSTTKAILKEQMEKAKQMEDVGKYKLQIEKLERELRRVTNVLKTAERERSDADKALTRARATARQLKEQTVLFQAREEGRKEGFDEGLNQGRLMHGTSLPSGLVGDGEAYIEELPTPPDRKLSHGGRHSSSRRTHKSSTRTQEARAQADIRKIEEAENLRIKMQLKDVERKLDAMVQTAKDSEKQVERLRIENRKIEDENRRFFEEHRRKVMEADREREDAKRRDEERLRRLEDEKRQIERGKERELQDLRKQKERVEREKIDVENRAKQEMQKGRQRIKILEEERKQEQDQIERAKAKADAIALAHAKEKAALVAAAVARAEVEEPVEYRKMPSPPPKLKMAPGPGVGRTNTFSVGRSSSMGSHPQQQQQQRQQQRPGAHERRSSVDSYSSTSTSQFEVSRRESNYFDAGGGRRDKDQLSIIPEDVSVRTHSPGKSPARPSSPLPSWAITPPPDMMQMEKEKERMQNGGQVRPGSVDGWRNNSGGPPEWPAPHVQVTPAGGAPNMLIPQVGGSPVGVGVNGNNNAGGGGGPSYANPNPSLLNSTFPHAPPMRRTSSGGSSNYKIRIQPPSRPHSAEGFLDNEQESNNFLSPNQGPVPLPQQPQPQLHQQQYQSGRFESNGVSTQPNSPVIPPSFLPHDGSSNANGRSTPMWHPPNSPQVNTGGGFIPPPVRPPSAASHGHGEQSPSLGNVGLYGNPLNKERDKTGGESQPVWPHSPGNTARSIPGLPPTSSHGITGWNTPRIHSASLSGNSVAPGMPIPSVPVFGSGNAGSVGGGTGMPVPIIPNIIASGGSAPAPGAPWGASPHIGGGMRMRSPVIPNLGTPKNIEQPFIPPVAYEDESDDFDATTQANTARNAVTPAVVFNVIPGATGGESVVGEFTVETSNGNGAGKRASTPAGGKKKKKR